MYTPHDTATQEAVMRMEFRRVYPGWEPIKTAVRLTVHIIHGVPVSWPKKKQALANTLYPTVKPDVDNVVKLVMDALNGVAWVDDKQVVSLSVLKEYGTPKTRIYIEEMQ
jgi:Holliday junction resolvase RusA-like endonuclease